MEILFLPGIVKGALPIKYDCFFLPFIGTPRQTLFPISYMNKAIAHRICLIGISTEPSDYDAAQNRPPSEFLDHDLGHGRLFSFLPGLNINCFSPETDPLLKKIHPIWKKTSQTKESFYEGAFFMAVHEGCWSVLDNIFRYTNLTKLEEALTTELNTDPKLDVELEDFANDEFTFYSNFLRKKNITLRKLIDPLPNDYGKYCEIDPISNENLDLEPRFSIEERDGKTVLFIASADYQSEKRLLFSYYSLLLYLKIDLPRELYDHLGKPQTMENFDGVTTAQFMKNTLFPQFSAFLKEN